MSFRRGELTLHRPWSQRLHGYLSLARISNSPTVGSNVLAGAALAGVLQPDARTAALVLAMVLFYTAGMFLNDLCDYSIDRVQRPERPLPRGVVSLSEARLAVAALFGVGLLLLWSISTLAFLSGLLLVALIALYDVWHKENPLSPLIMASTRLMVYVTAFLAYSSELSSGLLLAGCMLVLYLIGLTYIAKTETRPALTAYWPAVLLFLPLGYWAPRLSIEALPLLLLFGAWVAYSISFVYRSSDRSIGGAIARLIAGISLLDGLALASVGSATGVALALLAFGATLFLQSYIKGT